MRSHAGRVLTRAVALALLASTAPPLHAQSRQTDQELKDLIPDSAIDNPQQWAVDTPAARQPAPAPDIVLSSTDPVAPLPDLAGLTLAWPDGSFPTITPLEPETDLAEANKAAAESVAQLREGARHALQAQRAEGAAAGTVVPGQPVVVGVGKGIELALPADEQTFPERDAFVGRFAAVSSLKQLGNKTDTVGQITRRAAADRAALVSLLRLYGYYDSQVYQTIGGAGAAEVRTTPDGGAAAAAVAATDNDRPTVRFDVTPGPAYHLRAIELGDLPATGADYPGLRKAFPLVAGDVVNTDRIIAAGAQLNTALGETGYVFAKVGEGELTIDHEPRVGDLSVPVTHGGKYVFGAVNSAQPGFLSSDHLSRIARFETGDLAKRSGIDDLRQAILATGLVSAVTVTPVSVSPPTDSAPGTVDIDVTMTKAPLRTIAGQIGYSSGQGARAEVSWEHRNLFPPEGMLRVRAVAGTREQLAGITFRRNNFRTRDQVLTGDLYVSTVKYTAYTAKTVSLLATLQRQATLLFQKPWTYSFGVQLLATRDTNGTVTGTQSIPQTYFIAALPLQGQYDGSNDLLDPTRGFRVGATLSPEISVTQGRKYSYVKAQFDASYYQPVGGRVVVAARARFGTIAGAPLVGIAPSRRFYAGGGGSVRGYGYQAIGPTDTFGAPSGGRSLSEFSLEGRVKTGLFGGAVSVVPFVDAGAVDPGSTPTLRDIKVGAGLGLRYQTNFGPIRIDVGTPLNRGPKDSRIAVYVALGQAF